MYSLKSSLKEDPSPECLLQEQVNLVLHNCFKIQKCGNIPNVREAIINISKPDKNSMRKYNYGSV